MAADPPANGAAPAPVQPVIIIRFAGPGSAQVVAVEAPGTIPHQLYLAAWLLDAMAHEARAGEAIQAIGGPLVGGSPSLTPAMADIVRDIIGGRRQ